MKVVFEPSDSSTGPKMEPVEKPPTYAALGIDKSLIKEMPKNEGAKGQLIGRGFTGGTKMEPPINKGKSETPPPTYNENYA